VFRNEGGGSLDEVRGGQEKIVVLVLFLKLSQNLQKLGLSFRQYFAQADNLQLGNSQPLSAYITLFDITNNGFSERLVIEFRF